MHEGNSYGTGAQGTFWHYVSHTAGMLMAFDDV